MGILGHVFDICKETDNHFLFFLRSFDFLIVHDEFKWVIDLDSNLSLVHRFHVTVLMIEIIDFSIFFFHLFRQKNSKALTQSKTTTSMITLQTRERSICKKDFLSLTVYFLCRNLYLVILVIPRIYKCLKSELILF